MNKVEFSRAPPKSPFAKRYGNFIKWKMGYELYLCEMFRQRFAGERPAAAAKWPVPTRRRRGGARRRARGQGRLGPHQRRRTRADPQPHRRPHGGRTSTCWRSPRPGTTASRSARRRRPTCRSPSTISATSPARSAPRKAALCEIDHDTVAYHFHEPLGVVGQIIPWNFPLLMACWKLAPGAGRRQLRGAQAGRADAGRRSWCWTELIGDLLPPGVLNVVNGFGARGRQAARVDRRASPRSPSPARRPPAG